MIDNQACDVTQDLCMDVVCVLYVRLLEVRNASQICLSSPFSARALRVRFAEGKNVKARVHTCTFV